ncbi:hypothetical protein DOY81_006498 [Sarcophaga bullata]|nr:hypothetical protein DOY81_006498 [Sarcophaga bullata]
MSFLNKEERAKCWGHRDEYWKCLNEHAPHHSSTSGEKIPDACKKYRKLFETNCPATWVKHFDRKRTFEQFKEKLQQGYDPLNGKATNTAK